MPRALTAHQRIVAVQRIQRIGHQRREIVSKDVSPFVIRDFLSPGDTRIARTQEAVGSWRQRAERLPAPPARGVLRDAAKPWPVSGL